MMTPPLAMPGRHQGVLQRGGGVVVLPDGAVGQERLGCSAGRLEKVDGMTLGISRLGMNGFFSPSTEKPKSLRLLGHDRDCRPGLPNSA